jgi:hypothetical protein
MHRLILGLNDDELEVDHIFHIKHDNRKDKLRIVTKSQNQMNTDIKNVNTSGVKGVSWNKRDEVWEVYMQCTYMGRFYDFNKAVEYRKKLEEENYGEYSYDNSMNKSK